MVEIKTQNLLQSYEGLISEIVQKMMVIVGPQIALDKAKNVAGLSMDAAGTVLDLSGDPYLVVKNLLDEYSTLSVPIVQTVLCSLIEKYPKLQEIFNRPITKIEVYCPNLEGVQH